MGNMVLFLVRESGGESGRHPGTDNGHGVLGVSLADNAIVRAADPASPINMILYGANRASDVRASVGNEAGAVSPGQVTQQR